MERGRAMRRTLPLLAFALLLSLPFAGAAAEVKEKAGCADHPLFTTRMPNYLLVDCQTREFDAVDFFLPKGKKQVVEGKYTYLTYGIDDRKNERSPVEIIRNYENALKKIGGTIAASDPNNWVNGSVTVDGKEVWVQAQRGNGRIWIKIVEKQAMAQTIVADAAAMGNDLKSTGHTALYGILFDTGKSDIKPESDAAIGEIAKLLKGETGLKLFVVGHTDTVGGIDANLKLSKDRAEAVLKVLTTKHGIAADRLKAFGNGPFAPVATNDTDEGRGKNRRVELVKQ
jgi:outer membrane protein OmpA-like peptidoglycan-associated protein